MTEKKAPHMPFAKAAQSFSLDFHTEAEVSRRANAYEQNRRDYFKSEDWRLAGYALDLLLEKTKGKMRNDGVTPEWIHSARPTELLASLTQSGFMNRRDIEGKYGPYEIAICGQLLHDLGENEGVSPEYLTEYFRTRIHQESRSNYPFLQRLNDESKINPIIRDFKLLTYAKNGEMAFDDYLYQIMQSGYGFLVKLGDRADNLATLIGINKPDWKNLTDSHQDRTQTQRYFERIGRYYRHTSDVFSTNDLIGQACRKHTQLAKAYDAMDDVLGFLFRMNRAYYGYHPENMHNSSQSSKRLSGSHLEVDVSDYIEKAHKAYEFTHHGVNPMEIIMSRIALEAAEFPVLKFNIQYEPRDRGISPPSTFDQVREMFNRSLFKHMNLSI